MQTLEVVVRVQVADYAELSDVMDDLDLEVNHEDVTGYQVVSVKEIKPESEDGCSGTSSRSISGSSGECSEF